MNGLLQSITIYHKNGKIWERYPVNLASVRNTSIKNRNNTGVSDVDKALIRLFDVEGYNKTYFIKTGDVIVSKIVNDEVNDAPLTELKAKYGQEHVFQVTSIDEFIFEYYMTKELQHIKIGAK